MRAMLMIRDPRPRIRNVNSSRTLDRSLQLKRLEPTIYKNPDGMTTSMQVQLWHVQVVENQNDADRVRRQARDSGTKVRRRTRLERRVRPSSLERHFCSRARGDRR